MHPGKEDKREEVRRRPEEEERVTTTSNNTMQGRRTEGQGDGRLRKSASEGQYLVQSSRPGGSGVHSE